MVYDIKKKKGGKSMEDVIIKLAEIEAAASSIMDSVAVQKKKML